LVNNVYKRATKLPTGFRSGEVTYETDILFRSRQQGLLSIVVA